MGFRNLPGWSLSQLLQSCPTLCNPMGCSPPGSSVHGVLQVRTLEWAAVNSNHLILCCPLLLLPSVFPRIRVFSNESALCNSSVQFSHSVVSDSLRLHESQHARPPCPPQTPRVHSGSRPSSKRCHPAISSWVVPFFSCPQSLPASESFPMSQFFS